MKTWRMKFADRTALLSALDTLGWTADGIPTPPLQYRLDELGHLPDVPPSGDPIAGSVTPGTLQNGWFVNILDIDELGLPATLASAEVTPTGTPYREFAVEGL